MAPVVGDGEAGFRYDASEGERFELPGLWLNSEELHALLAAQQLLLAQRRRRAVDRAGAAAAAHREAAGRAGRRQALAGGARARDRQHRTRTLDEHAFRIVAIGGAGAQAARRSNTARAPPTSARAARCRRSALTHYRDNWYLDAWDHDREALRSFSVDRIAAREGARRGGARHRRRRTRPAPGLQLRHLLRPAEGLGDDRVQRQGRALGRRRALAFAAAGPLPARRPLRAEGAVQRLAANC